MSKLIAKAITQEDVALFLATKKRKNRRPVVKGQPRDFVAEFSTSNLQDILMDHRKSPITLGWVVRKMLDLLEDEYAKVSDKIMILDKLKELLLLGAIQDRGLAESVTQRLEFAPSHGRVDPFKAGKLHQLENSVARCATTHVVKQRVTTHVVEQHATTCVDKSSRKLKIVDGS